MTMTTALRRRRQSTAWLAERFRERPAWKGTELLRRASADGICKAGLLMESGAPAISVEKRPVEGRLRWMWTKRDEETV